MKINDTDFYRVRLQQEIAAAASSDNVSAAEAHKALAEKYAAILQLLEQRQVESVS